jgi:uncharacterized membrane protein
MTTSPERMAAILRRVMGVMIALMAVVSFSVSAPALAHKEHKKKPAQTEQTMPAPGAQQGAVATSDPNAMHAQMGEMMEGMKEDRSKMTSFERLLDWLGRLHPMIVHFPIAFFPAALFTAIVGRRRPAFAKPVQFLVVAGGIIAPIAAVLGWFDGGFDFATDDALLSPHRWLGTAIGVGGLALAIWAWRKPEEDRGNGMIVGLAVITAAIIIQGWFGGAMVHGIEHMNW